MTTSYALKAQPSHWRDSRAWIADGQANHPHHSARKEHRSQGLKLLLFDENPGRRSINRRLTRTEAEEAAKKIAREERDTMKQTPIRAQQ